MHWTEVKRIQPQMNRMHADKLDENVGFICLIHLRVLCLSAVKILNLTGIRQDARAIVARVFYPLPMADPPL